MTCAELLSTTYRTIFAQHCINVRTLNNRRRARALITMFSVTTVRDYGMPLLPAKPTLLLINRRRALEYVTATADFSLVPSIALADFSYSFALTFFRACGILFPFP